MARAGAARRPAARSAGPERAESAPGAVAVRLDRLIHERIRLGMVSALAAGEPLTFNDLKALLRTSDGNLSVHARKLEDGGYVSCSKTFVDRVPQTTYRLTPAGHRALQRYLDHMEAVIRAARNP